MNVFEKMNDIMQSIIYMSISGSIVALLLFIIKPTIKNKLSKKFQYYVWFIVIAQLFIPFRWELSTPQSTNQTPIIIVHEAVAKYVSPIVPKIPSNFIETPVEKSTSVVSPSAKRITLLNIINIIYPLGVAVFFLWQVACYIIFTSKIRKAAVFLQTVQGSVKLFKCDYVKTPIVIGILKPQIILPDMVFNEQQLTFILNHEFTHLKHKDLILKWIVTFANCLHWFNPMVFAIRKEIARACELACDEAVIKTLDASEKQSYGETLISVVSVNRFPFITTTMCEQKKTLKERLLAIMKFKKQSKVLTAVSVFIVLSILSIAIFLSAKNGENNSNQSPSQNATQTTIDSPDSSQIKTPITPLDEKTKSELINTNLEIISSSPQYASSTVAYISEHKVEYNEILALGEDAKPLLMALKANDKGLKGAIATAALKDIMIINRPKYDTIDQALSAGVIDYYSLQGLSGELLAESHVILGSTDSKDLNQTDIEVYALIAFGPFQFVNSEFIGTAAYEQHPYVVDLYKTEQNQYCFIDLNFPTDGGLYEKSIKEMFPSDILDKIWPLEKINEYDQEIADQTNLQAKEYLESLPRDVLYGSELTSKRKELEIPADFWESLDVEMKYNQTKLDIIKYPNWEGTCEYIEDGKRYIYKTVQEKRYDEKLNKEIYVLVFVKLDRFWNPISSNAFAVSPKGDQLLALEE